MNSDSNKYNDPNNRFSALSGISATNEHEPSKKLEWYNCDNYGKQFLRRKIEKDNDEKLQEHICELIDKNNSIEFAEELKSLVRTIRKGERIYRTLYNYDSTSVHDDTQYINIGSFILILCEDSADYEGDYEYGYDMCLKDKHTNIVMHAKSGVFFKKHDGVVKDEWDNYDEYIPLTHDEEQIKKELELYNVTVEDYIELIFILSGGRPKYEKQKEKNY